MESKKNEILLEFINALKTSGFNEFTLNSVASNLNITQGELALIFPYGMQDVAKSLLNRHIDELVEAIAVQNVTGTTEKVKQAVLSSFNLLEDYKTQTRKLTRFLLTSLNIVYAPKFVYKIADAIWKECAPHDTTFSFYTKRAILSTIYTNCFFYFLLSKRHEKLEQILNKQLELLTKITKKFKG